MTGTDPAGRETSYHHVIPGELVPPTAPHAIASARQDHAWAGYDASPRPSSPHPLAPVPYVQGQQAYAAPVQPSMVMMAAPKSVGVSLVLTFFFGAFGMFYSTVTGALVMLGAALAYGVLTGILSFLTLGVAAFVMIPLAVLFWPAQMVWGAVAASQHNARLQSQVAAMASPHWTSAPR